jgi:DNA-binding MarR family transcriptional regulator
MSKVVDSFEAIDLVERDPPTRVTLIEISPAGRQIVETQRLASTRALEEALSTLASPQRDILVQSLAPLEELAEILPRSNCEG